MFERLLIANRGEIACRVIDTASRMGLRTVAVCSEADATAKHVALADAAVCIGAAASADSYLRGDRIIEAALNTGCQAIHPGYGFLSENPDFVDAVEAAGLTFVGPSAAAIRAMGLKDAAKTRVSAAGVPVVPGYHGQDQSNALLAQEADAIGYPLLIKAVAGGGGKGMRLVERAGDFATALSSARSEAQTAFGNADVLVEKFIAQPRHIEVQVFGDGVQALHLFERDCSLQRRHQKVIEEAPAPGMTQEMRAAMGEAAVAAAQAIGYAGAGTVEFIVDGSGALDPDKFYFMEMNTRLQVEHPVTEAITGVDLVEWQLRVAAGEPLPCTQDDLTINGHAFEARLYAEDVPAGFLPATGQLAHLAFPADARADSGVRSGDAISPWYDPMIAKIIVHGPTRMVALAQLRRALSETHVAGTVTNLSFLGALAAHAGFARGEVDTGLIARDLDALTALDGPSPLAWIAAGLCALELDALPANAGFALWQPLRWSVTLTAGDLAQTLQVEVAGADQQRWYLGEAVFDLRRSAAGWTCDGQPVPRVHRAGNEITVFEAYGQVFTCADPLQQGTEAQGNADCIEAPMPGLIKEMVAKAGQTVAKGDRLAVLEAMKMEHALLAPRDGIVAEVLAEAGAQVAAGAALVQLTPAEDAGP
ncbi:MAG: biotin carboxylase N-terminal domain-containing protein [Roseobacter sp.]